jgi:hypothetical protein
MEELTHVELCFVRLKLSFPKRLDKAGKVYQGKTLWLIAARVELRRQTFYKIRLEVHLTGSRVQSRICGQNLVQILQQKLSLALTPRKNKLECFVFGMFIPDT